MNNYQIYEEVGKGQYCTVYKGRKKKTIEYFAVMSVEKSQRQRVLSEVQILHSIAHPGLVQFYNWYETNNHLWLILEFCPGGDLSQVLKQDKRLPEETVRLFGRDLVIALLHIHSKGVVHCDLKPSNVLVDMGGFLKIRGFGRSLVLNDVSKMALGTTEGGGGGGGGSQGPERRGTVPYMAPELFREEAMYSHRSDLWSLGCVLYEIAAGRCPWTDPNISDLILQITSQPHEKVSHFSAEFNDLIDNLLQKDPLDRASWEFICQHDFWKGRIPYTPPSPHPEWDLFVKRRAEERKVRPNSEEARRRREEVQRISISVENAERERRNVSRVQSREQPDDSSSINKRVIKSGTPIESLMFHSSDTSVKPIIFNPKIERENDNKYETKELAFSPRPLEELKKLEKSEFELFVKECTLELNNSTASHSRKLNLISYLESVCIDTQMANTFANGSLMTTLLRLCDRKDLPSPVRQRVCTCMGLLVRYATIVNSELGRQGVWSALLTVLKEDKNNKVRRRCLACMGELLFYVATQTHEERKQWSFDPRTFCDAYIAEVTTLDDEVAIHYVLRTLENLCGNSDTEVGLRFITRECIVFLWNVFTSERIKSESVKLSAVSTISRMCRIHAPAMLWIAELCPLDAWPALISSATSRNAQFVINIFNTALCKIMCALHTAGHELISKLVLRDPRQLSSNLFDAIPINLLPALANNVQKISQAVLEVLDQNSLVVKGKCILTFAMLFAIDPVNVTVAFELRLPTSLERILTKESDSSVVASYSVLIDVLRGSTSLAFAGSSSEALRAVAHAVTTAFVRSDLLIEATVQLLANCVGSIETQFTSEEDVRHVFLIAEALSQDAVSIKKFAALFSSHFLPHLARIMSKEVSAIGDVRFLGLKMSIDVLSTFLSDSALYAELKPKIDATVQRLLDVLGSLLADEEPIPLYALKLINVVSSYDSNFLSELHRKGVTKHFMDFYSLEHKNNNIHNVTVIHRALRTEALPLTSALEWDIVPKTSSVIGYAYENNLDAFLEGCVEVMRGCLVVAQKHDLLTHFAPWSAHVQILLDGIGRTDVNICESAGDVLLLIANAFSSSHPPILEGLASLVACLDTIPSPEVTRSVLAVLTKVQSSADPEVLRSNELLMLHVERLGGHTNEQIATMARSLLSAIS